jgi:hypothetical protein
VEKTKWWEDVIEHLFPGDSHCIHCPSFLVWDWIDKCLQFIIRNEGSSIVIETLPRSDSKTVSVDSHRQYDSGGLSSESRGSSLLFPVSNRNTSLPHLNN